MKLINSIILAMGAIIGTAFAETHEERSSVILRAPFDGYVIVEPVLGAEASAAFGGVPWRRMAEDTESCDAGFLGLRDFPKDFYSEQVDVITDPIMEVHSPLLEQVIAERRLSFLQADKEWEDLKRLQDRHREVIDPQEIHAHAERRRLENFYVEQRVNLAVKKDDKEDEMSESTAIDLGKTFDRLVTHEAQMLSERLAFNRNVVLAEAIVAAYYKRTMGLCRIDLAAATASLGSIHCPFDCRIDNVFVSYGQWVIKGDPLVEIVRR